MADVFISYVREDLSFAQRIARALGSVGISVWWDRHIRAGAEFGEEIEAQLTSAKAVIVIWSAASVESAWVRDEAAYARDQKRLVPLQIDASQPPLGFRQVQALQFNGWKGDVASESFADLVTALRHHLGSATATSSTPTRTRALPRRSMLLAAIASLAAAVMLLAWMFSDRLLGNRSELPPIRSLAVLPLENLSGDPEQGYFADAMTETLIAELAQLTQLRVISRTSVMQYKGAHRPLPEIADELKVDGIIEGSVLRSGGQVRITAQLIDARIDRNIWAQRYDRELARVLDIQSDVARAVAGAIELALSPRQTARFAPKKPIDPRAQDAYFRGLAHRNRWDEVGIGRSVADFEEAIAIAPDFAAAHASLAASLHMLTWVPDPPEGTKERAKQAALRAVELDDGLGDAHMALGVAVLELDDWDWSLAEREVRLGRELGASDPVNRARAANVFWISGRSNEALAWTDEVVAAAPLDLFVRTNRVILLDVWMWRRQPEQALEEADRIYAIDPGYWGGIINRGPLLEEFGRFDDAIQQGRRTAELYPEVFPALAEDVAELEKAWRSEGAAGYWRVVAQTALSDLPERKNVHDPIRGAAAYTKIGELDNALAVLDQAADPWALARRDFAPLRADARFVALARRLARSSLENNDLVAIALAYASIDAFDETFAALEQACEKKAPGLLWNLFSAAFERVRSDPRFATLTCVKDLPLQRH